MTSLGVDKAAVAHVATSCPLMRKSRIRVDPNGYRRSPGKRVVHTASDVPHRVAAAVESRVPRRRRNAARALWCRCAARAAPAGPRRRHRQHNGRRKRQDAADDRARARPESARLAGRASSERRGYGGADAPPRAVTSSSTADDVGDEPLLLARADVPVWVGRDRPAAAWKGLLGEHADCDVILADDGLQHYALARTVEIAVVDASRELGNGHMLPAGPLREPASRLSEVDAVVRVTSASGPSTGTSTRQSTFWLAGRFVCPRQRALDRRCCGCVSSTRDTCRRGHRQPAAIFRALGLARN